MSPADFGGVFASVEILEKSRPLSELELSEVLAESDVSICQLTDRIDARVAGKRLKHLCTYSVGLDHLDIEGLKAAGVRISHTPSVLTDATADLTWALILGAARRVVPASTFLKHGHFNGFGPKLFVGKALSGATLGILGMGRIGQAVARRAEGFGMKVIYHSRSEVQCPYTAVSLEALLERSDVLSIHCPLNAQTRHLIGADALSMMKPDALIVNTARGPIIEEVALLMHLRKCPQFLAGLDVYEREPQVLDGLSDCDNALCLPHLGSAALQTRVEMAKLCVQEVIRFAKGESLRYEVK